MLVHYVDYGNAELVAAGSLFAITTELCSTPACAIKFTLQGLDMEDNVEKFGILEELMAELPCISLAYHTVEGQKVGHMKLGKIFTSDDVNNNVEAGTSEKTASREVEEVPFTAAEASSNAPTILAAVSSKENHSQIAASPVKVAQPHVSASQLAGNQHSCQKTELPKSPVSAGSTAGGDAAVPQPTASAEAIPGGSSPFKFRVGDKVLAYWGKERKWRHGIVEQIYKVGLVVYIFDFFLLLTRITECYMPFFLEFSKCRKC